MTSSAHSTEARQASMCAASLRVITVTETVVTAADYISHVVRGVGPATAWD